MKLRVAKYILALLLPAVLLLPSCSDGLDLAQQTASLEVARTELDGGDGNLFLAIKARGKWTLSVEQGTAWLSLSTTVGSGDRNNVVIYYDANPRTEPRTGIIVLETESQTVRIQLVQSGAVSSGGAPGSSFGFGFLQYAPQHWLELPQTSVADGYDFFYRNCSLGGVSARNYAFYWNYSDRVSLWVAYPLTNAYMGTSGRTEAWGYDPFLPASKQQNVSGGYKIGNNPGINYARGHQLPSADRTASKELNATTFYGTNMTPQDNDFNSGIWATLEGKVRDWAGKSDTLYVVTGCVVKDAPYYVTDRSGARITVPTAYFKAVLRYQKNSTIGHGNYMAAGFWFEHKNYANTRDVRSQAVSISELETRLGYSLFVNLPDKASADIVHIIKTENPANVNWWWQ